MNLSDLMTRTLLLDLETTRSGKIRHIGALLNGRVSATNKRADSASILKQLDEIARDAEFVLGSQMGSDHATTLPIEDLHSKHPCFKGLNGHFGG